LMGAAAAGMRECGLCRPKSAGVAKNAAAVSGLAKLFPGGIPASEQRPVRMSTETGSSPNGSSAGPVPFRSTGRAASREINLRQKRLSDHDPFGSKPATKRSRTGFPARLWSFFKKRASPGTCRRTISKQQPWQRAGRAWGTLGAATQALTTTIRQERHGWRRVYHGRRRLGDDRDR
jgi:hypothetical protein